MSSGAPRLGEVEPRERVGAQTSRKYEYQYERTARAALELLSDGSQHICVYCDWHDDYVAEIGGPLSRYTFHQVKGRKSSQGPWRFAEFFGVARKKTATPSKPPASVSTDAIVPLMILHYNNFGNSCAGLAFVTNAGLDPTLNDFIESISTASNETQLTGEVKSAFQHLARAYVAASPCLVTSETQLFTWLRGLQIYTDQGNLESADAALLEIAAVAEDYSEIELTQRQAKQIARDIVSCVRTKVAHSTTVVPTPDDRLRRDKGIVIAELLNMLSLSAQAYEALKAGDDRETVKTLSRLERFCGKNGLETQIVQICSFKAGWDIWRTVERHFLKSVDYTLLESKAKDLLRANFTIAKLVAEAKDIAKQFSGSTATPLTPEHVLGLVFSVAAQTEALKYAQGGQ
jgi:Cap4 dsDNA endonuclease